MKSVVSLGALAAIAFAAAASAQTTPALPDSAYSLRTPQSDERATPQTQARPVLTSYQPVGDVEVAPMPFLDLCTRSPSDCAHWPDSDLDAIEKRATDLKVGLFRRALNSKIQGHTQKVLTVGAPNYLAYSWLDPNPADDSVFLWPTPADTARIKDDIVADSQPFDFGLGQAVLTPDDLSLSNVSQTWPTTVESAAPAGLPDIVSLMSDHTPFTAAAAMSSLPASDAFREQADVQFPDKDRAAIQAGSPNAPVYPQVRLTPAQYEVLRKINGFVNRAIIPETDADQYHMDDYWVAPGVQPGARGDCEDYALEKRRLLLAQGFPAAAMSLAIVSLPEEKNHVVLIVTTTDGDYVLDNLSSSVNDWRQAHYSWIVRQGPDDDLNWFSLFSAR